MNGTLFRVARILTIAFIALLLALLALDIWYYPAQADALAENWTPNATWSVEATQAALAQLGWRQIDLANVFFVLSLLTFSGIGLALGLLILWKKSDDPFGLFVAFSFVLSATGIPGHPAEQIFPALQGLESFLGGISWQLGFFIYYLFPDGHFVPRQTRWTVPIWLSLNLYSSFLTSARSFDPLTFGGFSVLIFGAIGSQIYRYFRHSDSVARQQTKVLVYALMLVGLLFPIALMPFLVPALFLENGSTGLVWAVGIRLSTTALFNILPVAIGVAILRYRLWDIDVIIRRTLIYSTLTVSLALVYFGIVILLQQLFRALTNAGGELAIILSTLAIYIMFNPLRARIQDVIDHRFYRRKYDAQKVLAQFAVTARDEVELDKLTGELVRVINETIQPSSASLWLRPIDRHQRGRTGE